MNPKVNIKILDLLAKSNIQKWLKFFNKTKNWNSDQIKEYQNIELKKILKHAYENTEFYSNYKIDIREIGIDNLHQLPVIRREDISLNLNKMIPLIMDKYKPIQRSTGGTTGDPLKYYSDKDSWSLAWALKYRDWSYGKYHIGDKMALLAGASLIPNDKTAFKRRIWNYINGFHPFSTTHYNEAMLAQYYNIIKKNNIKFLRGYPTSILSFAEFVKNKNKNLDINSIFTTAEVLESEHRLFIEEVFNCKIFDQYGCADAGGHASECQYNVGMHMSFESSICEVINIEKNYDGSQIGELVYTNLTNYAMPTIRYAPGDIAEIINQKKCECGRDTFKINKIVGRTTDRIQFSNGYILAGPAFNNIFRKFDLVSYQLIQNTKDTLDINVVKNKNFNTNQENKILKIMQYHCGESVRISLNYVDEIGVSKISGKHRFIISNVEN